MKKVYVCHSCSEEGYRKNIYEPLKAIKEVYFIFPHEALDLKITPSKEIIRNCDYVIADVSQQKLGVGIEIGYADAFNISVIFIYRKGAKLSRSLSLVSDKFIEYDKVEDITDELEQIIKN